MKLADRCKHDFESGDKSRGRSYCLDDSVALGHAQLDGLTSQVEGSYDNCCQVIINWSEAAEGLLGVECDCPHFADGWNCKHIWATLLEMDRMGVAKSVRGSARLEVLTTEEICDFPLEPSGTLFLDSNGIGSNGIGVVNSHANSQLVKKSASSKKKTIPHWQQALNRPLQQLNYQEGRDDWRSLVTSKRREAWYVLDMRQCVEQQALVVDLFQRETKKNGEFGKYKQLSLSESEIATFNDRVDRELLATLFDFPSDTSDDSGYDYRYSHYETKVTSASIPESLYEHLLPRLAATGRFVWHLDSSLPTEEARPLAWDDAEPWKFQLELIADDKKKKWTLTGSYQRGEQVRPLTDAVMPMPTGLLLMDGKLARLDTKGGAFDWLTLLWQTPAPIEIPYHDRELFLQQLWSLPTLPPLTLPDNLEWQEIREAPQPCLKVHATRDRTASMRQKLGAEVAFRYGELEISAATQQNGVVKSEAGATQILVRDHEAEAAHLAELGETGVQPISESLVTPSSMESSN